MKATVQRSGTSGFTHRIEIRDHELLVDEPPSKGGEDAGPTPQELLAASLAACTAITLEMYAKHKDWELGELSVECEYESPKRGAPTEFRLLISLPKQLDQDQLRRLRTIAAKCPVHRTLAGKVRFEERIELVG
jgi:putative redox protein